MTWRDIENKLCEQAEAVCRHLYPAGVREGAEWVVGSLAGEAGRSLKINLGGQVGLWRDFAGDKGGKSLCSLWLHARGLQNFGQAVKAAREWLGLRDDFQPSQRVRNFDPAAGAEKPDDSAWKDVPTLWKACEPLTVDGPVYDYLVKKRGLDADVLQVYDVREYLSGGSWKMVFPYYAAHAEDELATVRAQGQTPHWLKFEALHRRGGKKVEWTSKAPEKSLFGIQLDAHPAFSRCRHVLICEGEKDALAWASYGCAGWGDGVLPVSVPFGAKWKGQDKNRPSPNREWMDRAWDWLDQFETVFVAMDGDEPGQRAAADIINEIGPRRCRLVSLPEQPA